ncbi:MAG: response regulator transcription factor [Lachnospiraceae bacterium]|jgi:DNA-binding response OmpR family regulator|nr:response regulator transcription factor [Lachnospiraceae bacterium]
MDRSKRILLVEDDNEIRELLCTFLSENGYETDTAANGMEGLKKALGTEYDLILLDIMLPYKSGDQVLKELRERSNVPVIVLSAKDMVQTKIDVIRIGADDYVTKPFDLGEVLVRMEALLRRSGRRNDDAEILRHKNLSLHVKEGRAFLKGKELSLTVKEYAILQLLLANPNKVFSRSNIFDSLWEDGGNYDDNAVKVHVSNLRSKLAALDSEEYVETVWGMGYRLAN